MKLVRTFVLIIALLALSNCKKTYDEKLAVANQSIGLSKAPEPEGTPAFFSYVANTVPAAESLSATNSAQATVPTQANERKIIRNAELIIEADEPQQSQQKISTIAEKFGGFVVSTEAKQNQTVTPSAPATVVSLTVRVPAAQFGAALAEIRASGGRILREKITGQDVTEEYIDLEARLRTKRALEMQFLEIMKQARKVSEALEVQTQITEVRTEIERLEGRRRFLENQAALSTITMTLQTAAPLVAATTGGFWQSVKTAFGDGVDDAVAIVLGLIHVVLVMLPIGGLILLPAWLLLRKLKHRFTWTKHASASAEVAEQNQ